MKKKFIVIDFYENPFGDKLYIANSRKDAEEFCKMFEEETDGECNLVIREVN